MKGTGPAGLCNERNELLTESGCVRAAGHTPPHTTERRYAELLDERDELEALVAVVGRDFLEGLRAGRRRDLIPFYVVVPVSRELALDGAVDVAEFVERHARRELELAVARFREEAGQ